MNASISFYSDVGGRPCNEDTVLVRSQHGLFAMVADGVGGSGMGDAASQAAARTLEALPPVRTQQQALDAVRAAHEAVLACQTAETHMKTTLAALWIGDGEAWAVHVGDSRIYQFRGGQIVYQSADHSVPQMAVVLGEITPEQIRTHPSRNRILRALGSPDDPIPCVQQLSVQPGDAFLVCSDGFWEPVLENEMIECLSRSENAQEWLFGLQQVIAPRLGPGSDNNTAAVIIME